MNPYDCGRPAPTTLQPSSSYMKIKKKNRVVMIKSRPITSVNTRPLNELHFFETRACNEVISCQLQSR